MLLVIQASRLFEKRKSCLEVLVPVCSLVGGGVTIRRKALCTMHIVRNARPLKVYEFVYFIYEWFRQFNLRSELLKSLLKTAEC